DPPPPPRHLPSPPTRRSPALGVPGGAAAPHARRSRRARGDCAGPRQYGGATGLRRLLLGGDARAQPPQALSLRAGRRGALARARSEEHTSELPSLTHLLCRLL